MCAAAGGSFLATVLLHAQCMLHPTRDAKGLMTRCVLPFSFPVPLQAVLALIEDCVASEPDLRPTASQVLQRLQADHG